MSPLDRQDRRTHSIGRAVAAVAFAGALSAGGVAAADPAPAPQAQAHKARPAAEGSQAHAAKRRPVRVDIHGVSQPAYVVTRVVHLPSVAPHRTEAAAHKVDTAAHRNEPGHRPSRRVHRRPASVVRCQSDDTDQTEDLGDDAGDESGLTPPTRSGSRCPTNSRGGLDFSRLFR